MPLVNGIPSLSGGHRGRPHCRPKIVQGDRAYDSQPYRYQLWKRGIQPVLAHRFVPHGSGLGIHRWVVERSLSWLHQFRRLRVRFERRSDIREALLFLACAIICWRILIQSF